MGCREPEKRKVLAQLQVSDKLTTETKAVGAAPFAEVLAMGKEAIAQGIIRDFPPEFLIATMEAMTQASMELIAANPSHPGKYRAMGFERFGTG